MMEKGMGGGMMKMGKDGMMKVRPLFVCLSVRGARFVYVRVRKRAPFFVRSRARETGCGEHPKKGGMGKKGVCYTTGDWGEDVTWTAGEEPEDDGSDKKQPKQKMSPAVQKAHNLTQEITKWNTFVDDHSVACYFHANLMIYRALAYDITNITDDSELHLMPFLPVCWESVRCLIKQPPTLLAGIELGEYILNYLINDGKEDSFELSALNGRIYSSPTEKRESASIYWNLVFESFAPSPFRRLASRSFKTFFWQKEGAKSERCKTRDGASAFFFG